MTRFSLSNFRKVSRALVGSVVTAAALVVGVAAPSMAKDGDVKLRFDLPLLPGGKDAVIRQRGPNGEASETRLYQDYDGQIRREERRLEAVGTYRPTIYTYDDRARRHLDYAGRPAPRHSRNYCSIVGNTMYCCDGSYDDKLFKTDRGGYVCQSYQESWTDRPASPPPPRSRRGGGDIEFYPSPSPGGGF